MTLGNYLVEGTLQMMGERPIHNDYGAEIAIPEGYTIVPKHRVTYSNGTALFIETL